MTTATTNDQSEELLILAVYAGMLRHACQSALDLLQDPNAIILMLTRSSDY